MRNLRYALLTLFLASTASATTRYAGPSGSGSACTVRATPCSLQSFANGGVTLNAGDTVILLDGTYTNASAAFLMRFGSGVTGTAGNPITFRAETWRSAILDCKNNQPAGGSTAEACISTPFTTSQYITFKDVIITNSSTATRITTGQPGVVDNQSNPAEHPPPMNCNRKGWVFQHCIMKDNTNGFDGDGSSSAGPRTANWILNYYNGFSYSDRGHGHGVYAQQTTASSDADRLIIKDNFNWNNGYAGVQIYTGGSAGLNYITLDGAVIFNNGIGTTGHWLTGIARTPIVWGGEGNSSCSIATEPVISKYPIIKNSEVWEPRATSGGVSIGYRKGTYGAILTNNFFAFNDLALVISRVPSTATVDGLCSNATISNNTIYGTISGANFPPLTCNEYGTGNVCTGASSLPTTSQRKVYKTYDGGAGEGALVVYNWNLAATVTLDPAQLGGFAGEVYNIYSNNAPLTPIPGQAGQTWDGSSLITLNTSGYTVETIGGTGWDTPVESGPRFIVFFFEPAAGSPATPTPTNTPTNTRTNTPSPTKTFTPTLTATITPTATATLVNTNTPTVTGTATYTPSVTPSRTPTPSAPLSLSFEAEQCVATAPMVTVSDAAVFAGGYSSSPTTSNGKLTCTFTAPADGTYYVWARVYGADSTHDSFYIDVDGDGSPNCVTDGNTTCTHIFDTASNKSPDICQLERAWGDWLWTQLNDRAGSGDGCLTGEGAHRQLTLTAGVHVLTFRQRDPDTRIDQVIMTTDSGFTPSDVSLTPTPTPAPFRHPHLCNGKMGWHSHSYSGAHRHVPCPWH